MKRLACLLVAIVLAGLGAHWADAQCNFNTVSKAKGGKLSMVRAFAECTSTQHPTTNTTSASGLPVCSPVLVKDSGGATPYILDPRKGECKIGIKTKLEHHCESLTYSSGSNKGGLIGLPAGACTVSYLDVKCKGITDANGTPVGDEAGSWKLRIFLRASAVDSGAGDVQVFDYPLTLGLGPAAGGQIKATLSTAETAVVVGFGVMNDWLFSDCASFEILKIEIADSEGRPFARLGSGTRGKEFLPWPYE